MGPELIVKFSSNAFNSILMIWTLHINYTSIEQKLKIDEKIFENLGPLGGRE